MTDENRAGVRDLADRPATRLEVCEQVVRRLLTDRLAQYSRSSVA